jgi:hypothetical protein
MATVNQRIPNFLGGVSQQPDKIKFPGQLRVCDNAVPDITFGLKKRPPAEFVGTLTGATSTGHWYEILRDGDEKYLIQITESNVGSSSVKPIRVWALTDLESGESAGTELALTNAVGASVFDYLDGATSPYAVTTIQDYTLIANPNKEVAKSTANTGTAIENGDYGYARLDTVAYNTEYILYHTTSPTPKTYYRVTSLKVDKVDGTSTLVGPTWDATHDDAQHAGMVQFDFSGGDAVTQSATDCDEITGTLTVNGTAYIANQIENYDSDGSGQSSDFLGYTQDYDTRYTATVTLKNGGIIKTTGGTDAQNKQDALDKFIRVGIEGIPYQISVEAVEPVTSYEGVSGIGYFKTPKNPDSGTLSMGTILNGLATSVNNNLSNVTSEVVGSGLFLKGSKAASVNFLGGAVNENMSVISQKAQDISRLPAMNKHGYVAQISNTADLDTDDYYVKFVADSFDGTNASTAAGAGSYEETVRPHQFAGTGAEETMELGFNTSTMPHALINNRNGTFTFVELNETTATSQGNQNYWKNRVVGDNESNPFPTITGRKITEMFFHRNRLGLISEEQVVMSQPGQYFNLFIVSAIAASDDNPIDITVSDIKPAFINHTLPINKGIMMFSDNAQFLLFTESDIFSPKTVRLKKIASYECDATIQPVDLGTSVLFTSNVSAYARAFEATVIDDDAPTKIIEQTRVVPEFLPKDITKSTNSAAIGITTYGKKGSSEVYHYKYYEAGNTREQSAWYSWTLTGTMQHMLYTGGSFFTVTLHDGSYKLCRHEYVADIEGNNSYVLGGFHIDVGSPVKTARQFEVHLDNMTMVTFIQSLSQTNTDPAKIVCRIPYVPANTTDLFMVGLKGNDSAGDSIVGMVQAADAVGSVVVSGVTHGTVTFNNINVVPDTNLTKIAIGYKYTSTIELPTYYVNLGNNAYDTDGDLRISGINFELGASGPMQFHLTSPFKFVDSSGNVTKDIDDYIQYESGLISDASQMNLPPASLSKSVRVPVQRKNEKYTLQIKIPDPFSTALISASWDGIYNPRRHVRR